MQRRTLLKAGLIGGAVLAAAGATAWLLKPSALDAAASAETRLVLISIVPALLDGALPTDPAARAQAIEGATQRTLAAIASLPRPTRLELGELFALLASRPGRWLAGVERWEDATVAQTRDFLQRWRTHSFSLFQTGYHALHDLVLGPYYADPSTWERIGYPGPIRL